MKIRLLSTVIAFAIAFCGVNLSVLNAASHANHDHDDEHTELGEQMETVSKTFRSLRRQAKDPSKNASSAALAAKMHKAATNALKYEPVWKDEQPKGEQDAFVKDFKKEMEKFIGMLADLESAFKAGNNDKANAIIGKIRDQQKSSHKSFKAPDDD
jgi:soluble cytochrome b562